MWIVRLALNRPLTFIVMAIAIMLLTPVAVLRTPTDIFPKIDIPVISMVFNFGGLTPTDIEQRVSSISERYLTTTVNDIEHIESQSYNGIAVIKVFFHPIANIQTALAQVTSAGQSVARQMPAGAPPPLVVIYNASTAPVVQLALMSQSLSEQRADSLAAALEDVLRRPRGSITRIGKGDSDPLPGIDQSTAEGRALNRRCEVFIQFP